MLFRILFLIAISTTAAAGGIDLHDHLFMKEGLGFIFNGRWDQPLMAKNWKSHFTSKSNGESLLNAGPSIVVVSLYANGIAGDLRKSIRAEIEDAHEFAKLNPDWIIAMNAQQAQAALKSGRHVMILSLEGASGILESENDLREFIDEGGIRIVTLMHLTDDEFGGVAFLKGWLSLSSAFALVKSFFSPVYEDGVRVNPRGLTDKGREILKSLMDRNVWIDLAHASDAVQKEIIGEYQKRALPVLYTHTTLRRYYKAERGISDAQLLVVKATGGVIGLMPSMNMLGGTPGNGIEGFAKQYKEASSVIGADNVMIGSDFNAPIDHLPEFWKPTHAADLWAATSKIINEPVDLDGKARAFLAAWTRVFGSALPH